MKNGIISENPQGFARTCEPPLEVCNRGCCMPRGGSSGSGDSTGTSSGQGGEWTEGVPTGGGMTIAGMSLNTLLIVGGGLLILLKIIKR